MKLKTLPLLHLAAFSLLTAQIIPNIAFAQAQPAPPLSGVLGKVQSFTGSSLEIATPSGIVRVAVTRLLPPDPDADARIEAARDQAGEPEAETLKAIETP